ncbi:MAG: histidinol-phosphate transaminase [Bacillota bacterium]|nr:histidinol-phosphate transaminase [Bacillota bacterium]
MSELKYREALDSILNYKPAKSLQEIQDELGIDKILKLSANENAMGCSPLVYKALQKLPEEINLYPDFYCTKLREKLIKTLNVKEEQLIFGNGSFELISLLAQAFINSGEESIIPEPSFGWYKTVTLAMNGVIKSIPLRNHKIDLKDVLNQVNDKTKIIWLCNPNNPTGTIFEKQEFEKFIENIPTRIILVLDEAYIDFVSSDEYFDTTKLVDKYKNIISLRTFSKVYGLASLRIGYGIADKEIIDIINKIRLPINVNAAAQAAALASLNDENFKKSCIENNKEGKEYYYKSFSEMGLEYIPTETNFIMVNVLKDSMKVTDELLRKGISLRAGTEFGMNTWLRITIGKIEENILVIEKLKQVLNYKK